jgi:hypothetical protein
MLHLFTCISFVVGLAPKSVRGGCFWQAHNRTILVDGANRVWLASGHFDPPPGYVENPYLVTYARREYTAGELIPCETKGMTLVA